MNHSKINVWGIISLILGIQALVTSCMPPLSIIIAFIALITGVIGLLMKERQKGQAIAGLCCSATAITIFIMYLIFTLEFSGELDELIYFLENITYFL